MHKSPLVSVIIPTKNSSLYLSVLLKSIKEQTYKNVEIIVVDNYSKDKTQTIAKEFTKNVYIHGTERSEQRNYGAGNAKGEYIFFIDSDMVLTRKVIEECVEKVTKDLQTVALIIPEESIGEGFWAKCKQLERSFYVGVSFMEAARFFKKGSFLEVGGYNTNLISGEDWYLSQKLEKKGKIGRIKNKIFHNEGKLSYFSSVKKKYYYARYFSRYINLQENLHLKEQVSIYKRYLLFFSYPKKLFKDPFLGIGMLFLKTSEFGFGGIGYLLSLIKKPSKKSIKKYE